MAFSECGVAVVVLYCCGTRKISFSSGCSGAVIACHLKVVGVVRRLLLWCAKVMLRGRSTL